MTDRRLLSCARLLEQGHRLDQLSTGLSVVALAGAVLAALHDHTLPVTVLLALTLLAGVVEKYWAMRVAFDAALFADIAQADDLAAATTQLDAGLTALGLMPAANAGREWTLRCQGALGLLRKQGLSFAAQLLLALAAVAAGVFC